MHVDTHVLELEYYNYENVKPFKNKISLMRSLKCLESTF
jgi:hypothetical protein